MDASTLTDRTAVKAALVGKDYIETIDWTVEELEEVVAVSLELKAERKAGQAAPAAPGQDALHALPRQVDAHPQRLRDGHDPARRPRDLPRRRQDAGLPRREPEGHGDHPRPLRRGDRDPPRPRPVRGQRLDAPGGRVGRHPADQPAVRHRPPDPDDRRPDDAAREARRQPARHEGRDDLGLRAVVRAAALGAAGDRDAPAALRHGRRRSPTRPGSS